VLHNPQRSCGSIFFDFKLRLKVFFALIILEFAGPQLLSEAFSEIMSASKGYGKGSLHHLVDAKQLNSSAKERLIKINQEDTKELFSLRLNGEKRIWGIKERQILQILWWDPSHKVYPLRNN
jgi:hypothetical protein